MCGDDRHLVYVIEPGNGWFFWSADIEGGCWVRDAERATRYPEMGAAQVVAADVSDREAVDARVIRESEIV